MKNKFYTKEEIDFLKENIDKFGVAICAEKLERTQNSAIQQCYRKIGHCSYLCKATKKEIEELVFDKKFNALTINFSHSAKPKELAYFLGYFWADGYIRGDDSLVIEIIKEDADDIEHIFNVLADFTIYERTRKGKKTQKTFFYKDYEHKVPNELKILGKYPKSIESHEKIIKYIPNNFINYFIRGLIDGDGNLYVSPQNSKHYSTQITISGRNEQDWNYIIEFVKNRYDLNFKPQNRAYKNYKSSVIRATDKIKIIHFLKEIYKEDDGIYLTRKFNKIKELIKD